ncbi:MAG TPA: DUF3341 domain-containing protein [Candidatus Binatia bacterium]|nr:DUF3341 domain-containing protein [Candidatus Binatia bacterium]
MIKDPRSTALIAIYQTLEAARAAVTGLRQRGFKEPIIYSPLECDRLQVETGLTDTSIGLFALGGATVGAATGLLLTIGTSMQWPLMTGGQPIVSLPPFFVICFELTILFGVLATVVGMFWRVRRSRSDPKVYDPRFSADRFGVYVTCEQDRIDIVRGLLAAAGAEEVRDAKS